MKKHVKSGLKIECNIPRERDKGRKGQRKKGTKEERGKSYRLLEAKL
jgi:hypothetical protein